MSRFTDLTAKIQKKAEDIMNVTHNKMFEKITEEVNMHTHLSSIVDDNICTIEAIKEALKFSTVVWPSRQKSPILSRQPIFQESSGKVLLI